MLFRSTEDIQHYVALQPTGRRPIGDQKRQVREMLIFFCQFSILKWYNRRLYLDLSETDLERFQNLDSIICPMVMPRKAISAEEFLSMTSISTDVVTQPTFLSIREVPTEEVFTEGKRTRVTHLKIERSPTLRRLFFREHPDSVCDMCNCNTQERYPWTNNLLEIHHILPLSSTLAITASGTSLDDVVALCPTCHRATHGYYKNWLNSHDYNDFQAKEQVRQIYSEAKDNIRL